MGEMYAVSLRSSVEGDVSFALLDSGLHCEPYDIM